MCVSALAQVTLEAIELCYGEEIEETAKQLRELFEGMDEKSPPADRGRGRTALDFESTGGGRERTLYRAQSTFIAQSDGGFCSSTCRALPLHLGTLFAVGTAKVHCLVPRPKVAALSPGTGLLSRHEFRECLHQRPERLSPQETSMLMQRIDEDEYGQVRECCADLFPGPRAFGEPRHEGCRGEGTCVFRSWPLEFGLRCVRDVSLFKVSQLV